MFHRLPVFVAVGLVIAIAAPAGAQVTPRSPPRDTLDAAMYEGWKQFSLVCARCHGDDALGTSFAPSLIVSLKPDGPVPTQASFVAILTDGRLAKGMPPAAKIGLDPKYFEAMYRYLKGRSDGVYHGGRPARRGD